MTNTFDLAGRVALVTGASQGLGRRFATTLANNGARVCVAARSMPKLEELAQQITAAGGSACAVAMDVLDTASIERAVAAAEETLGPIDILVNNAGVAVQKPFLEQTEADWDAVVGANLKGAFLVAQAAARSMCARRRGSIVNIASMLGFGTITQLSPYVASKGGLVQLTRNMALELARYDVRVNAIAPGYIATDMTEEFFGSPQGLKIVAGIPSRRIGRPEDLDGPLLLLASDAGRYMTGSTILVDGGFLLA